MQNSHHYHKIKYLNVERNTENSKRKIDFAVKVSQKRKNKNQVKLKTTVI